MMVDLVLERLPDVIQPADILATLTTDSQVGDTQIGRIWINKKKGRALIQVQEEVVPQILKMMKTKKISGSEVTVALKTSQDVQRVEMRNYINTFKNLLYLERGEELVKFRRDIRTLTGEERQKAGQALLNLRGRANAIPHDDFYEVRFIRDDGEDVLPPHEMGPGDMVIISLGDPVAEGNAWGMVTGVEPYAITVEFRSEPPIYVYNCGLRLDLAVHDRVFQQTVETLKDMTKLQGKQFKLAEILLGEAEPAWGDDIEKVRHPGFDEEQIYTLNCALKAQDLFLINGGAGTGKTTVGIEILRQHIKRGKKVLAVGTSLGSRDDLAARLEATGLKVLRYGTVDLKNEPEYYAIHHLMKAVQKLMKRRDELPHPFGQWLEGLSYKDILLKAQSGANINGIPNYRLKEVAEWIEVQHKIEEKNEEVKKHQERIWARILSEHDLICAVHYDVPDLQEHFDLVVIDDAHRITEPEILTAYFKGDKVILIGDTMQIPPRVVNGPAREGGLAQSAFVRLSSELDGEWISTLKTQHRLHPVIWQCVNAAFASAGQKTAVEEEGSGIYLNKWRNGPLADILEDPTALIFLDTSGIHITEERVGDEYVNQLEADLVWEILQSGVDYVLMRERLAILTFYQAQVHLLKDLLERHQIDHKNVYTVDDFAGNEKDLVVISLVHSNAVRYLGKSSSIPHLITALTRASRKCIVIGNGQTFDFHPIYKRLFEEINLQGKVYQL